MRGPHPLAAPGPSVTRFLLSRAYRPGRLGTVAVVGAQSCLLSQTLADLGQVFYWPGFRDSRWWHRHLVLEGDGRDGRDVRFVELPGSRIGFIHFPSSSFGRMPIKLVENLTWSPVRPATRVLAPGAARFIDACIFPLSSPPYRACLSGNSNFAF